MLDFVRRDREHGFTLAEILIVVVIIGILAAFVLPRFFGAAEKSRLTATAAQIQSLGTAIRLYYSDYGKFPSTDEGLVVLLQKDEEKKRGPYLEKEVPIDPWGNEYKYLYPGDKAADYDLWSMGPDAISGTEDDLGNW